MAAAALLASLCACTSTNGTASSASDTQSSAQASDGSSVQESTESAESAESEDGELAAVVAIIKKEVDLPDDMDDMSAKRLERLTGLSDAEMADFAGMICTNGVSQDQMIFIKAKTEADVATIVEKLKAHHESQYSVTKNYNPEQAVLFENSDVETDGLYVSLVISPDADKINEIYKENLNK